MFFDNNLPWFIITRKHTQMTPPHKIIIVQSKQRIIAIQKLWMKHNFHTIISVIEHTKPSKLVQDGVVTIICHVVCYNGWECVPTKRVYPSFQNDQFFFCNQFICIW